jgi:hypothetical protein
MSSVAEVKADSDKVEGQREEIIAQNSGEMKLQLPLSKVRWRCSHSSQAPLADALNALAGEESHSDFGKQVSVFLESTCSAQWDSDSKSQRSGPGVGGFGRIQIRRAADRRGSGNMVWAGLEKGSTSLLDT